jgi:hypothetical protein
MTYVSPHERKWGRGRASSDAITAATVPPPFRLLPAPFPGGLGGAALWPNDYANPGSPTWRGRNSGSQGGSGGSGVVIIRYPQVFGNVSNSGSPDVSVTPTGFIHYTFTGSGSITFDYNP